jgi:hypothetical protein
VQGCPELGAISPRAKAVDGPFRDLEALDMHNWQDCTGLCWVNVLYYFVQFENTRDFLFFQQISKIR